MKGRDIARVVHKTLKANGGEKLASQFKELRTHAANVHAGSKGIMKVLKKGHSVENKNEFKHVAKNIVEKAKSKVKEYGRNEIRKAIA